MSTLAQAVGLGMLVMLAGTVPRNIAYLANTRHFSEIPWAVPVIAVYLWLFWRYVGGAGAPVSTQRTRQDSLRANAVSGRIWVSALLAGGLGIIALVIALRVANRIVVLPPQQLPPLANVPATTIWALLLAAAPIAGVVEEAAFRGYMQGPLERRFGIVIAIVITGTMFAIAHLDFKPSLWPYYVAVSAIYGTVTYLTNSIRPAVVLHTAGNLYSNTDLLLHGQAEWQAPHGASASLWQAGLDAAFVTSAVALAVLMVAMVWAYRNLAAVAPRTRHAR